MSRFNFKNLILISVLFLLRVEVNAQTPTAPTGTVTVTPVVTITATVSGTMTITPTPQFNCIFAALGDSYVYGEGASSPASIFAQLTYNGLSQWYPKTAYEIEGKPATRTDAWLELLPIELEKYKKEGIPLGYALLQLGSACFFYPYHYGDYEDCCKGATLDRGIASSYVYQKNMSQLIGEIYAAYPDVHLVVPTVPDPGCGDKTYALPAIFEAYRKRLYELQPKYPNMRIVDLYSAMAGHLEYFKPNGSSKLSKDLIEVMEYYKRNHPNDLGQTIVAKCILEKFKNWEYVPQPSKKTGSNIPDKSNPQKSN
jgi:hypothetical protein